MSNEFKDWLYDTIYEAVIDSGAVDRVNDIVPASYFVPNKVSGQKNGQEVNLVVWFDDETGEWRIEHRETDT